MLTSCTGLCMKTRSLASNYKFLRRALRTLSHGQLGQLQANYALVSSRGGKCLLMISIALLYQNAILQSAEEHKDYKDPHVPQGSFVLAHGKADYILSIYIYYPMLQ